MKCPYCKNEMEKGKTCVTSENSGAMLTVTYVPASELHKPQEQREVRSKVILSGGEQEAWLCTICNKIFPVLDI